MEVSNSQKEKHGMYKETNNKHIEKISVNESIEFIEDQASRIRAKEGNIYASIYSNTGTIEFYSYRKEKILFSKFHEIIASRKLLKRYNPDYNEEIKVYLQSYQTTEENMGNINNIEQFYAVKDIQNVELVIDNYLKSKSSDDEDYIKFKSPLELAKDNVEEVARKMNYFQLWRHQIIQKKNSQ